jgi:hypothetical protein
MEGTRVSYVIETGIPLPKSRSPGGNRVGAQTEWTRAIEALDVGQSVFTPSHDDFKSAEQFVLRQRPKKFALRKVTGMGWRVWRLE